MPATQKAKTRTRGAPMGISMIGVWKRIVPPERSRIRRLEPLDAAKDGVYGKNGGNL